MSLPHVLVTGASGFIGRHLLDSLKERCRITGIGRRSQARCGAPFHENISWHQVDIGEAAHLEKVFAQIQSEGPVDFVIHLAAHYDFSGENHPEYHRTNVVGLRNVLEYCRRLRPKRFLFSSSTAASDFPVPGRVLNEASIPDGDHLYAQTKAIGEQMLGEYADAFPSTIVRFAALFSDWCEYPPLYMFLRTWLSTAWNARILGGRGESAIPYLHVNDAVRFLERVLEKHDQLEPGQVVIASPDGAISHKQLFAVATEYFFERQVKPIFTPKALAGPGIHVRCFAGRFMSERPFERPWMAAYIDKKMTMDASVTRRLLDWAPRERFLILNRIPFLLENRKYDPVEWTRRNRDAMKQVRVRPNLKVHSLLQKHREQIGLECTRLLRERFPSYREVTDREHSWNHQLILGALTNAIRMRVKAEFMTYCHALAERRFEQGFAIEELVGALEVLDEVCYRILSEDPESADIRPALDSCINSTIRFGIDQVLEVGEQITS